MVTNREKRKAYNKKYHLEHKDGIREQKKKYRLENIDRIREHKKKYNLEHKDEIREINKNYKIQNPEKGRAHYFIEAHPELKKNYCEVVDCKLPGKLEAHHPTLKCYGWNITLCKFCHARLEGAIKTGRFPVYIKWEDKSAYKVKVLNFLGQEQQ